MSEETYTIKFHMINGVVIECNGMTLDQISSFEENIARRHTRLIMVASSTGEKIMLVEYIVLIETERETAT